MIEKQPQRFFFFIHSETDALRIFEKAVATFGIHDSEVTLKKALFVARPGGFRLLHDYSRYQIYERVR